MTSDLPVLSPDSLSCSAPVIPVPPATIQLAVHSGFFNKTPVSQRNMGFDWENVCWPLQQLADHVLAGKAISVAKLANDNRKTENFRSSQVILTDHDNGPGVQTLSEHPFIREYASFIYATASSKPEQPKSRAAFVLDQPVSDPRRYKELVTAFYHWLNGEGIQCDPATKDAVRMFYGSAQAEHVLWTDNVLPLAFLENLSTVTRTPRKPAAKQRSNVHAVTSTPISTVPEHERGTLSTRIRSALQVIPPQSGYEVWLKILMAVHSVLPGDEGIALIEAWSPGSPGEVAYKFASFSSDLAAPVTLDSLWHFARHYGWRPIDEPDADITFHNRYVTDAGLQLSGATLLKSDMGTGKTEMIKHVVDAFLKTHGRSPRVLVIAHRKALIQNLANRLQFESYNNLVPRRLRQAIQLVITPNSLHKLMAVGKPLPHYDIVIIDEVEQVLAHLIGKTFKRCAGVKANQVMRLVIKNATQVMAMDAHAGWVSLDYLRGLRADVQLLENTYHPGRGTLEMVDSEDALLTQLKTTVAQSSRPVVVVSDQRRVVKMIERLLKPMYGDAVRAIYSGNSQHKTTRDFLDNINDELAKLKVLICSPSVSSGVDIQTRVETVFGLFRGVTLDARGLHQMLGRCRRADKFVVYLAHVTACHATDKQALFKQHSVNLLQTSTECHFDPEGRWEPSPQQRAYLELYAAVTAQRNASLNDIYQDFVYLAQANYEVCDLIVQTAPDIQKEWPEVGRQLAQEHRQLVLTEPSVDEETYRSYTETGTLTPAIEAGHERWQIEEAYGLPITEDLLDEYKGGRGPERLARFVDLHRPPADLMKQDRDEEREGLPIQHRGHYAVVQRILREALGAVFGPTLHDNPIPEVELQAHLTGPFSEVLQRYDREVYELLGRRRGLGTEPLDLLRFCLKLVGLNLERRRQGKNHNGTYTSSLSSARYTRLLELAEARIAHKRLAADLSRTSLSASSGEAFLQPES